MPRTDELSRFAFCPTFPRSHHPYRLTLQLPLLFLLLLLLLLLLGSNALVVHIRKAQVKPVSSWSAAKGE